MLNTLLIGNPSSGAGHLIGAVDLPGRWVLDPSRLDADDCLDIDLIALFGGDGTIQKTVSHLLKTIPDWQLPPIAVLPFGTTNMTAGNLNRTRSRAATVRNLRWMIEHEQLTLQSRSMLRVIHGQLVEHGFALGLGAIAQAITAWNLDRRATPLTNQLRAVTAAVGALRAANSAYRIWMSGSEHRLYCLLVTSLDRLLFGSRPYWGEAVTGPMRLTWIDADTPHLLARAPALMRGSPRMAQRPGFHSAAASSIRLGFTGPWVLDGELQELNDGELTITITAALKWVTL